MPEVAECLSRRYRALDELISELSALPRRGSGEENFFAKRSYDPGIKLMCDFWNILKEDPDCDLSHAVKQRMGVSVPSNPSMYRQHVTCYMAGNRGGGCGPGRGGTPRGGSDPRRDIKRIREICCGTNSFTRDTRDCRITCAPDQEIKKLDNSMPLSKALCNLKEAASFDKKCNIRISALMETQKELKAQIQNLEQRERDGIQLLREADSMWSSMEGEYKNKIALSIERQKVLLKQLKEVEISHSKWRRNKKELEDELKNVMKSRQEITEKINQKNNDIKCIEMEIADFTRRISTNKRAIDGSKQALVNKKTASDKKVAKYNDELKKLKNTLAEVQKHKRDKEAEGKQYVQDAREDLQDICKVLLQKKLQNEDLAAEKEAILQEIDLLKETSDQCKDKCDNKRKHIEEEIKNVDKCIADYKYQCVQCHQCTDTNDARRLCSDCPKCKEQRECITAGDHCDRDKSFDCICVVVKEKFLNNVFENMYTVLERQTKTKPGKALADKIVKCLKNSRNGKLNCETRDQVKTFVLNTVRKNLNLTIVGGAVKTRCELDADSYKQLMCCIQLVKADKPLKEDKGTVVKKESCRRWGATSECNCPGGPAYCVCSRKAPPPPKEPTPCPDKPVKDKGPPDPGAVLCPHKETISCGPDCAMIPPPPKSEAIVPTKANKVCSTSGCPFSKNMRAAQCVLGPESLSSMSKIHTVSTPIVPGATTVLDKTVCKHQSEKNRKASPRSRDKIIEEVMGRYTEITPIDKGTTGEQSSETISGENMKYQSICDDSANSLKNGVSQMSECSSEMYLIEGTDALVEMLRRKNLTHVCKTVWDKTNTESKVKLFPQKQSTLQNDGNPKISVVLYPKCCDTNVKYDDNIQPRVNYSSDRYTVYDRDIYNHYSNQKHSKDTYDVKKLMNNIIMLDVDNRNVEWMSVESLITRMPPQYHEKKRYPSKVSFNFDNYQVPVKETPLKSKTYDKSNQTDIKIPSYIGKSIKKKKAENVYFTNVKHKNAKNHARDNLLSSLQDSDSKCYIQTKGRSASCQSSVQLLYDRRYSFVESQSTKIKINCGSNTQRVNNKVNYLKQNVKYIGGAKIEPDIKRKTNFLLKPQKNTTQILPNNTRVPNLVKTHKKTLRTVS